MTNTMMTALRKECCQINNRVSPNRESDIGNPVFAVAFAPVGRSVDIERV